jgi:hypothetical protein
MNYLNPKPQYHIADTYHAFKNVGDFAKMPPVNTGNESTSLYVRGKTKQVVIQGWQAGSQLLNSTITELLEQLGEVL